MTRKQARRLSGRLAVLRDGIHAPGDYDGTPGTFLGPDRSGMLIVGWPRAAGVRGWTVLPGSVAEMYGCEVGWAVVDGWIDVLPEGAGTDTRPRRKRRAR